MKAKYSTRTDVEQAISDLSLGILPIGSCEQHGPHLPLGTDTLLAEYLAEKISEKVPSVIFPSVEFGYSWVWKELPGTLTLSQEAFKQVVMECAESMIRMGFKRILLVNGHDSNKTALKYILRDLSEKYPTVKILNIFYPGLSEIYAKTMESKTWADGMFHAEEFETSLMLAKDPDLVDMSKAVKEYPERPTLYGYDTSSLAFISKSGVYGDATLATREKGEHMIQAFTEKVIRLIKAL